MTHNGLLDACERFREDMGEVADNISLATALETLWAERVQTAAASSKTHYGAGVAFKSWRFPSSMCRSRFGSVLLLAGRLLLL